MSSISWTLESREKRRLRFSYGRRTLVSNVYSQSMNLRQEEGTKSENREHDRGRGPRLERGLLSRTSTMLVILGWQGRFKSASSIASVTESAFLSIEDGNSRSGRRTEGGLPGAKYFGNHFAWERPLHEGSSSASSTRGKSCSLGPRNWSDEWSVPIRE